MKEVQWKSFRNKYLYTLQIDDGTDSEIPLSLTPSDRPFVTQVDDDEDLFKPIREQTGNIGILGEVSVMEDLLAASPSERPVTLIYETPTQEVGVAWKGYLQTAAFSQEWDKGPNSISIPVVSHLGVIDSYYYESLEYTSFAAFIDSMSKCTGTAFYSAYVFPAISNVLQLLQYKFSGANFATLDDNTGAYEYETYYTILEEICKLFGWVAIEQGDTLCFIAPDSSAGGIKLTSAQLSLLASGTIPEYEDIEQSIINEAIDGASHTIDYMPGKRSVKINGDPNLIDSVIFRLDTGRMTQNVAVGSTVHLNSDRTRFLHYYNRIFGNSEEVQVLNQQTNPRYENMIGGSDSIALGSCVVNDREYVTKSSGKNILERDSGWVNRIIFKAAAGWAGRTVATISPQIPFVHTGMMTDHSFLVQFGVNRSHSYKDAWESFDGNLYITFKVGDQTLYDGFAQILNGKLCAHSVVGMVNSPNGLGIMILPYSGRITMEIKVPQAGDYWGNGDYDYYYSIENITISTITPWTHHLWKASTLNTAMRYIENGYTDELEQTNKLTCYDTDQYGHGVVLNSNLGTVSSLYNGSRPESALADRMAAYYGSSRKRLSVMLRSHGTMMSPLHLHIPGHGNPMVCLSQSIDWRDDIITANLYESMSLE